MSNQGIGRRVLLKTYNRLPLTFHNTFAPEVPYLSKIMYFAACQRQGNKNEISDATGIPTGTSSGKVGPTINYAQGMGLIQVERGSDYGFALSLTDLGKEVFEQDRYLKENVTQWLLHLMFCRREGGAEAWYKVFAEGDLPLGKRFSSEDVSKYLHTKKENVSPLWRMYLNESGFTLCHVLEEKGGLLVRGFAPESSEYFYAYAYFLLFLWEEHFPNDQQVATSDFETTTKAFATLGFRELEANVLIDWMANSGFLKVDRLTGEPLLLKMVGANKVIRNLYDNLV